MKRQLIDAQIALETAIGSLLLHDGQIIPLFFDGQKKDFLMEPQGSPQREMIPLNELW